jgi:UDP-2,3-diacylglucosamine hydrolase
MIDAVFISDLHLHPDETLITERFYRFISWAATHTRVVYILGDFFHVWPGDDHLDAWSNTIAERLAWLVSQGVVVYFMPGNRDFLLGNCFFNRAGVNKLTEPTVITLGGEPILLVHGDRYCTRDKGHQWLRRLTRNRIFPRLFLRLPFTLRADLVSKIRQSSQSNRSKPQAQMDVVASSMLRHMQQFNLHVVIHGHIHKPGLNLHDDHGVAYRQYVLSDWDDNPQILCYDEPCEFYFKLLSGEEK